MYSDRSVFTVCMYVCISFSYIYCNAIFMLYSQWLPHFLYEEYLTVHSNSFQLKVWRLSPRLSKPFITSEWGRDEALSLCTTCNGFHSVQEYLGNWDFMLQRALAPDEDDASPLKKHADNGETHVCINHWNVRQWPFLCLNNRELSQAFSTSTP